MKHYLLILIAFFGIGANAQTANGTETKVTHTSRMMNPPTVTVPTGIATMGTDGTIGKINPLLLPITTATQTALDLKANVSDLSQTLTFETRWNTGDSNTFTLPNDVFSVISVTVQGISKSVDRYTTPTPNTITILDDIYNGNFIQIIYLTNSNSSATPYYAIDTKLLNYTTTPNSYLNASGNIASGTGYSLFKYPAISGDVITIKGSLRGLNIMSYAIYSSTSTISSATLLVSGQIVNNTTTDGQFINTAVTIPIGGVCLVLSDYGGKLYAYKRSDITTYVTDLSSKVGLTEIDAEGDSLTEGAIAPGTFGIPYTSYLQGLIGDKHKVVNNGYSGETTVEIGARQGGVPAVTSVDYTIPWNRAWLPLNLVSSYNGVEVKPLKQKTAGTSLPATIDGIKGEIQYWSSSVQFVRDVSAPDSSGSRFIPAGTPVVIGNQMYRRNQASVFWIGTNGGYDLSDNNDLINQIKALIGFRNNNYIVLGLHHVTGVRTVAKLEELEALCLKEFGYRYINIRKYCITNAIGDCGLTPTTADNTAISQGLCPPQLLGDTVHFIQPMYEKIAKLIYDRLKAIGLI